MTDPYCYPGTSVLRNLGGIRDQAELDAFEAAMVAIRLVRLHEEPLNGPFNLQRLLETHRRIFDGVYLWAGQLRQNTGTMSKKRPAGYVVSYGDSAYIDKELEAVFKDLQSEKFLTETPPTKFAGRAAYFYCELDAVHPFREGNSRTLRQFLGDLAADAGYRIDWTVAASTESQRVSLALARDVGVMRGDISALTGIIAGCLSLR